MGGIIVVDFIDMNLAANRRKLFQALKDEMAHDRTKHTILPPSKFGLVQITRQRVRPEMDISILEKCPCCDGTGEIKPSIIMLDELENNIRYLLFEQNENYLKITVHPFIYAYLTKGLFSIRKKLKRKFKKPLKFMPNTSHQLLEYHFYNKNNDEIVI
jgi:ribonuclease G